MTWVVPTAWLKNRRAALASRRGDEHVNDLAELVDDVAVRQRDAQVPAHREDGHLGREAEASEGRSCEGGPDAASSHDTSLAAPGPISADATEPARLVSCSMKNNTYNRRNQMLSTVKKLQATIPAAC